MLDEVEDPSEDRVELLPDPDPVGEVLTGEELNVGVAVEPVTTQEQADEIEAGELWH